ncbi:MAG: DsrE family protein [Aquificaceae bacterium]|nr:DsrE family protein [Aquificaceae bacterium]
MMRTTTLMLAGLLGLMSLLSYPTWSNEHKQASTQAQDNITLMVNLTVDKGMSPNMALRFALISLGRGNETILWLNSEAVKLADSKSKPTEANKMLKEFISKGGKVYVCPHCAKVLGVKKLVEGAQLGNPDTVFGILSKERVRVVSW